MQSITNSEKTYKVSYFRVASKSRFGTSIEVVGDSKAKVLREAKEMLGKALENVKEYEQLPEVKDD